MKQTKIRFNPANLLRLLFFVLIWKMVGESLVDPTTDFGRMVMIIGACALGFALPVFDVVPLEGSDE